MEEPGDLSRGHVKTGPAQCDLVLWAAQGFGIGRIPIAPGTFGTLIGFGWLAVLLLTKSFPLCVLGSLAGAGVAVWLCGTAEKRLGVKDPGSVVMDEVVAVPGCFWCWGAEFFSRGQPLLGPGELFSLSHWPLLVGAFVLFRLFDIVKPWPVRQSQVLPGGWGIVVDDLLAAGYVNTLFIIARVLGAV